jgi:hypothetical protein
MSLTSKNKGKAGERQGAELLSKLAGFDMGRRLGQSDADPDLLGLLRPGG